MIKYINVVKTAEHCGFQLTMETDGGQMIYGDSLSTDEALCAVAGAIIAPDRRPRYMRTYEEIARMNRAVSPVQDVGSPCVLELPGDA